MQCLLCDEPLTTPVRLANCEHIQCIKCAHRIMQAALSLHNVFNDEHGIWEQTCVMKPVKCPLCRQQSTALVRLEEEQQKQFGLLASVCIYCKSFTRPPGVDSGYDELVTHMEKCPQRPIKCVACEQTVANDPTCGSVLEQVQKHMKCGCKSVLYQCGLCWHQGTRDAVKGCFDIHVKFDVTAQTVQDLQRMITTKMQPSVDRRVILNATSMMQTHLLTAQQHYIVHRRIPLDIEAMIQSASAPPVPDSSSEEEEDDDDDVVDVPRRVRRRTN